MDDMIKEIEQSGKEALAYLKGDSSACEVIIPDEVDVKSIRKKLGMTQEDFAIRFDVPISSLRSWEQGLRKPERLSRAFFKVLDHSPETVMEALN